MNPLMGTAKLVMVATLALFYGQVALWSLHPQVSDSYLAYYIARTTTVSPYEQALQARRQLPLRARIEPDSDAVSYKGWSPSEGNHRWSLGSHSSLLFTLPPEGVVGKLYIEAIYLGEQRVTVALNGVPLKEFTSAAALPFIEIVFDAGLLRSDGVNRLDFTYSNPHPPGGPDQRMLAMDLQAIEIY